MFLFFKNQLREENLQFQEDVTILVEKNEDYHQKVCDWLHRSRDTDIDHH